MRHMTVRPWLAGVGASFLGVMAIGYLVATSYLVLRDDLIGASMARQARMQHAYEDRIAALRSQVDRVTSRQLLDQQLMENKVAELMERQEALTSRHGKIGPLLGRVATTGHGAATSVPVPEKRPERQASAVMDLPRESRLAALASASHAVIEPFKQRIRPLAYADSAESVGQRADRIFSKVTLSLKTIERDQVERIQDLVFNAYETANQINDIVGGIGLPTTEIGETALGGPFIKPTDPRAFETSLDELDSALLQLDTVRNNVLSMPVSIPTPGADVTSRFGTRKDPFLKRAAFHSGIDFRTTTGTAVYATGSGKVVSAGRNGGYGKMVEIDHGNGLTTRYAHLSKVLVEAGQVVTSGSLIAKSGSTGRSTGPHLHYEVRKNGHAINPIRFLKVAKQLRPLLSDN